MANNFRLNLTNFPECYKTIYPQTSDLNCLIKLILIQQIVYATSCIYTLTFPKGKASLTKSRNVSAIFISNHQIYYVRFLNLYIIVFILFYIVVKKCFAFCNEYVKLVQFTHLMKLKIYSFLGFLC